jgi:hypothetical protein
MQLHEPAPFFSLQIALEPHGDGLHGIGSTGTTTTYKEIEI